MREGGGGIGIRLLLLDGSIKEEFEYRETTPTWVLSFKLGSMHFN